MKLREMIGSHKRHLKNAKKLQKYVLEEFAHEKQYKKFADAVWEAIPESSSNVVKVFG